MKTLYIQCNMGVAGDMLMSALLELVPDRAAVLQKLNELKIPGVVFQEEKKEKCGIVGTHMKVLIHGAEEGETMDMPHHEGWHGGHHDHNHAFHHDDDSDHGHHHHHDHSHEKLQEEGHTHDHTHDHDHDHSHTHDHGEHSSLEVIERQIRALDLPEKVKEDAVAVYRIIAEAESQVHGVEMEQVHFHEVGSLDAVADVVGNCYLFHLLDAKQILASPVHVGSGTVHCAHGILPVPAPATALILQGIPYYTGQIRGELCTPTGAALLKYFVTKFCSMPVMTVEKTGYGMGKKDFPQANCVRVMMGELWSGDFDGEGQSAERKLEGIPAEKQEQILELSCNLDDMTGEEMGFAMEILLEKGALDVFTQPITMKKSRPAVKFSVLCRPQEKEEMVRLMFQHTSTIGVRVAVWDRYVLERHTEQRQTPWGPIDVKVCRGWGTEKEKAEYAQLAALARENDKTMEEVRREIEKE